MPTPSTEVESGPYKLVDIRLCEQLHQITKNARKLEELSRDNKPEALMKSLAKIEMSARRARWRLTELRPDIEFAPTIVLDQAP